MATYILAIDAATEVCSIALWYDGKIFTRFSVSPRSHAHTILQMVEQCLIDAHLDLHHINVLAFGRGPGSFTGIRIAVGISQGLAFGADLPMIGISSLLTIAQGVYRQLGIKKVLVAIDARMGEIYCACYELKSDNCWQGEETETILKPEQLLAKINTLDDEWAIAGTGLSTSPILEITNFNLLKSGIYLPDAQDMLPLALREWEKGKMVNAEKAQPVYLRNEVSWKKLPGR